MIQRDSSGNLISTEESSLFIHLDMVESMDSLPYDPYPTTKADKSFLMQVRCKQDNYSVFVQLNVHFEECLNSI